MIITSCARWLVWAKSMYCSKKLVYYSGSGIGCAASFSGEGPPSNNFVKAAKSQKLLSCAPSLEDHMSENHSSSMSPWNTSANTWRSSSRDKRPSSSPSCRRNNSSLCTRSGSQPARCSMLGMGAAGGLSTCCSRPRISPCTQRLDAAALAQGVGLDDRTQQRQPRAPHSERNARKNAPVAQATTRH
jgi:hypothetical protein